MVNLENGKMYSQKIDKDISINVFNSQGIRRPKTFLFHHFCWKQAQLTAGHVDEIKIRISFIDRIEDENKKWIRLDFLVNDHDIRIRH